jgi:hypothetical protein
MLHGIESRSITRHHDDMASSVDWPLKAEAGYNEPVTQLTFFLEPSRSTSNSSPTSTIDMHRRWPLSNLVEAFNMQKLHQKLGFDFAVGFQFLQMEITAARASFYKGFDPNL